MLLVVETPMPFSVYVQLHQFFMLICSLPLVFIEYFSCAELCHFSSRIKFVPPWSFYYIPSACMLSHI